MKIVSDYIYKILIEYIESEKNLNECYEIKNKYISNIDNANNTSKYVKKLCNIIVDMDRFYKYVWNIPKLLNDDIESYDKFISWQKGKINVEQNILDEWKFIYSIRNIIEHPGNLKTTFFYKNELSAKTPKIILNDTEYDLLELGEKSLQYVFVLSRTIISAAFLYSKYVVCFTDETYTYLYSTKPTNNLFEKRIIL